MLRSPVCLLCHLAIELDLDQSWVYTRSAVVQHVVQCSMKHPKTSAIELNKIVDQIMNEARGVKAT